jgi:hypothetical protein
MWPPYGGDESGAVAGKLLEAECAYAIAPFGPFKAFDAIKTAKGLYDLRKVRAKYRPAFKFANDILRDKIHVPLSHGFLTGAEIISGLKKAKTAYKFVLQLPSIAKDTSMHDFIALVIDVADIFELDPCIQGIQNAVE